MPGLNKPALSGCSVSSEKSERTGQPGNLLENLHSRYNPQAEALRYIDSLQIKETTECFILIEPGLGYMIPVLRERFKEIKIIALHVEKYPNHNEQAAENFAANAAFYGTERKEINQFLEKEVPKIDIDRIRVIEWRPSLNFYKESYISLLSYVVDFLKRMDAEKRTTAHFGKRWFRNFFRNLCHVNKTVLYRQTDLPVIITGSGPALEQAMPLISEIKDNCLIIAASSSVTALCSFGITADIIITTDGGNWALKHLISANRCSQKNQRRTGNTVERNGLAVSDSHSILAASLCAALPSQSSVAPFLIINDGSFWQTVILHELNLPSVIIPERGTVTATALDLAFLLSSGAVYLAGMDLSNNDIRTHVKPYAFDSIFYGRANRTNPFYSISYTRASLLKEGGSMNIYADWFKDQSASRQIFSLTKNSIFKISKPENLIKIKNKDELFNIASYSENSQLDKNNYSAQICNIALNALFTAMKKPDLSDTIYKELSPLLSPADGKHVTEEEILREVKGDREREYRND